MFCRNYNRILRLKTHLFCLIAIAICLLSTGCKNQGAHKNHDLTDIERIIWDSPEIAIEKLDSISHDLLLQNEQYVWKMEREHALMRQNLPTSPDSIMEDVIRFFTISKDYENLAKSYYIQGIEYFYQGRYYEAMSSLKNAETHIKALDTSLPYSALIFFGQGYVAESEQLFHIAHEAYKNALPYIKRSHDEMRIACCYRDIARTGTDEIECDSFYNAALSIADKIGDSYLYYDIKAMQLLDHTPIDSLQAYTICKLLVDSMGDTHYAGFVTEYILEHHPESHSEALAYLSIFAQDTLISDRSKEYFQYVSCLYEFQSHHKDKAFKDLLALYTNLIDDVLTNGKSRTYTISRMYDVEREQNKNLQLVVRQQHLWITIGAISGCTILLLLLGVLLYNREHQQRILKEQAQELEHLRAEKAENDLEAKREALRKLLRQRIQLTKQIRQSVDGLSNIPQKTQQLIGQLSFNDQVSWAEFISEFDDLYGNILSEMKKTYPSITEQDEQYIALSLLGLSNNEIAFLLQINPQSVWNRRQRLRNHMGNSITDLDNWLSTWQKTIR